MEEVLSYRDQNLEQILLFTVILQYYEYYSFYILCPFKMFFGLWSLMVCFDTD